MARPPRIGKYKVERVLGTGSFATVWLAYDEPLDAHVAIKVLAENWTFDPDVKRRFVEEARILWLARHDRIVRVHLVDELDDGRPYFVMDFADGGTLYERMRERFSGGARFSPEEAVSISREIAECLAVAHDLGIVHRDLKPSNVLFRSMPSGRSSRLRNEPTEQILLADFGLAKRIEHAAKRSVVAGTPGYMAPEQADPKRAGDIDERVDIFGASAILYELLAGVPPYPGRSMDSVRDGYAGALVSAIADARPDVPPSLNDEIMRGLSIDRERRHRSALEWSDAIGAALVTSASHTSSLSRPTSEASARVQELCERLTLRYSGEPIVGAFAHAEERLSERPLLAVTGTPSTAVGALVTELSSLDQLRVVAAAPLDPQTGGATSEIPSIDAHVCLLLLPRDPLNAAQAARTLRSAFVSEDHSPFLALGVLADPDASVSDASSIRRTDEVRSVLLTTVRLRWPDSGGPGSDTSSVVELLAEAYGGRPNFAPALGLSELAALVHRLVAPRADQLRADAAIAILRRALVTHGSQSDVSELADELERIELDLPVFAELAVLRKDVAGHLPLAWSDRSDLRRVLLGASPSEQLGLPGAATAEDRAVAALGGAERWRRIADRAPFRVRESYLTVARTYDRLWAATSR